MAWNGSGSFTRTNGVNTGSTVWADDAAAAVKIVTGRHDTHDQDIADGIAACVTKNGESKVTADFSPSVTGTYDLGTTLLKWEDGHFNGALTAASLNGLKTTIVEIGDWNMDADASVAVAHGLTLSTIRSMNVTIRDDNDSFYHDFSSVFTEGATGNTGCNAGATNVTIIRQTGGFFDSTSFDSTTYNRGWITIQHTA